MQRATPQLRNRCRTPHEVPDTLKDALDEVYGPAGMRVTDKPVREAESVEYEACRFGLDGHHVVFREAKQTPKKIGQFVTLWKRSSPNATIAPLDACDDVGFVVIIVSDGSRRGQFVFNRKTLVARGVMSRDGIGGKRAIRVYPPWSKPIVKEALRTQQWQIAHFLPHARGNVVDTAKVRQLFTP